jgi:4-amino-4-deoxy-L-arabinose transferase-like glycosyltransferase
MTDTRSPLRRPLAVSLALTFFVRLIVVAALPVEPRWDGYFYARLAHHVATGIGYYDKASDVLPPGPTAFYPVGYPAAMAAALRLAGDPTIAAQMVNLAASLIASVAVVLVAHRARGPRVALVAGCLHALYPGLALWSTAAMTETLNGALLVLAVACALVPESPRARALGALFAGVSLGLATLVRPPSILWTPLAGLARGDRLRALALCALGVALTVLPWTARNCRVMDGCALVSTNGGSNLLIGTFPDARGGYRRPTVEDGCRDVAGEVHRDRCWSRVALARIGENPAQWLALGARKFAVTFLGEHDPVSYVRSSRAVSARHPLPVFATLVCTVAWWALAVFAWRGGRLLMASGDPSLAGWTLGGALTVVLTHVTFLGADRYHLVLVPTLCPAAAVGLGELLARRGRAA